MRAKTKLRILSLFTVLIILAMLSTMTILAKEVIISQVITSITTDEPIKEVTPGHGATSFLLMGIDNEEEGYGGRTDVLMVVTLNPSNIRGNFEMQLVSIPRDTIAHITCGNYFDKINAAYTTGYVPNQSDEEAAKCTVDTVADFLNIPIDYYAQTDFDGIIELIDKIDGIDIIVDYPFCEQDSQGIHGAICIEEGLQTLDGEQALAYSRQRKLSSDFERNLRQQQVLLAAVKKIAGNPKEYFDDALSVFLTDMDSNLDSTIILEMAKDLTTLYNTNLTNISTGEVFGVLVKDSPYNSKTYLSSVIPNALGIDVKNVVSRPLFELTEKNYPVEELTQVHEIYSSKNATRIPTTNKIVVNEQQEESKPTFIEIQSTSISSMTLNTDTGWYGWINAETLYYVSNTLRHSLGLEAQYPTFDFRVINQMGGPLMDQNGNYIY